jgi:hypothetical protein
MSSVLIAATTILFTGLISHVKDATSDDRTAFFIAGGGHVAKLEVENAATFVDATSTWNGTPVLGSLVYRLNGQKVVINHGDATGTVMAPAGGDFDMHVPHLSKIVDATTPTLHPDVRAGVLHKSTASLKYSRGALDVLNCYTKGEVAFPAPATQGTLCVAQWARLTFTTTVNWEIQDTTNGKKIVVKPGATVRVYNLTASGKDHYLMHSNLLLSGKVVPYIPTKRNCVASSCTPIQNVRRSKVSRPYRLSPEVDCSSSQWP